RQIEYTCPACLDCLAYALDLVGAEIVHRDDLAGRQRWRQHLLDIGTEQFSVERAIDHQRRSHAIMAECAEECGDVPMPVWHEGNQPLAIGRTAIAPTHIGACPGFVDEDQFLWVQLGLRDTPFLARGGDIGALLLGGVLGLFLSDSRRRLSVSPTTA